MKRNRDDFSPHTVVRLRDRVAGRCSNPDHRVPTTGPVTEPNGLNNIGKAAHITAAASGGPRYDHTLTATQRRSIDNGIWLCGICADKIDKDVLAYPVDLLKEWKRQAEDNANNELGAVLPSLKELQLFKGLVLKNPIKDSIQDAVQILLKTAAGDIEKLDPRFAVEARYEQGALAYTLNAKETVGITMNVDQRHAAAFREKFSAMKDHGASFDFPLEALKFKGSAIFENLSSQAGKITIEGRPAQPASLILEIRRKNSDKKFLSRTIDGTISGGEKSFTFQAVVFDGLLAIKVIHTFDRKSIDFCFAADLSNWNGRQLHELPFLGQMREFYAAITDAADVRLTLEINGIHFCGGHCAKLSLDLEQNRFAFYLDYLFYLQAICKRIGILRRYIPEHELAYEDVKFLHYVWRLAEDMPSKIGRDLESLNATVTPTKAGKKSLMSAFSSHETSAIKMEIPFIKSINVLGELIQLPPLLVVYTHAWLKKASTRKLQEKEITISIVPSDQCRMVTKFL